MGLYMYSLFIREKLFKDLTKILREQIKNSSRRKLKFFAKKIEIVREQSEKSSRTIFCLS